MRGERGRLIEHVTHSAASGVPLPAALTRPTALTSPVSSGAVRMSFLLKKRSFVLKSLYSLAKFFIAVDRFIKVFLKVELA